MEELGVKMEEMRRDQNSLSNRFEKLETDVSELKDSVKRALDNLLPRVEALLANQASNVSNSLVAETPAPNVGSSGSLIQAALDNDIEAILRFLSRDDIDVEERNEEGDSALHVAAKAGHEQAVTLLLGNIPVDFSSYQGRTALHCAIAEGHGEVAHQLLRAGANCDAKDWDGDFPLLLAVKAGHASVVELLVNHNPSLDAVDKTGNSALVAAAKLKLWEIVKILLVRCATAKMYKGDDNAPLYLVAKEKNYSLLKIMIKKIQRREAQMKIALKKCNDPHLVHVFEDSVPGFCRTKEGRNVATSLAADGKVDVLRAMLFRGADVDGVDSLYGSSCLMFAAQSGHVSVMKLLLEKGASVDLRNLMSKWTALHFAAEEGHVECIRLLLEAKASVDIKNNQSKTPIDLAESEEIRQLLKSHSPQS